MFSVHLYRSIVCRNSYLLFTEIAKEHLLPYKPHVLLIRFHSCVLQLLEIDFIKIKSFFLSGPLILNLIEIAHRFSRKNVKKVDRSKEGDKGTFYCIRTVQIHPIRDNKLRNSIDTYRLIYLTNLAHIYTI